MFDSKRFLRLAAAHWAEQRKSYAWFIGVGIILHIVLLIILFAPEYGFTALKSNGQGVIYLGGLFLLAPIFAARYFQQMAHRQSALLLLMRPASVFEKWLLAVLLVVVAYPLAYTAAFYLCNIPAWMFAHSQAQQFLSEYAQKKVLDGNVNYRLDSLKLSEFRLFFPFSGELKRSDLAELALTLTSLQAFAIFGSLYFRKSPFIKTLAAGFMILLATILVATVFKTNADLLLAYWSSERPMSDFQRVLFPLILIAVPLLLWFSTFLALREREVAP